jgi:hypothetical protein
MLTATIDDNPVEAGITRAGTDVLTWIAAEAPYSVGLRLAVTPMARYPFKRAFRISTGHAELDRRFDTLTNDAPYARLWLEERVRELLASVRGYHFILEGGRCHAWRRGVETDGDNLFGVIQAVAALGNRGREIRRSWEWTCRSLGGRLLDGRRMCRSAGTVPSIEIESRGVYARIDGFLGCLGPRREGRGLFTRVRCRRVGGPRDHYLLEDRSGRKSLGPRLRVDARSVTDPGFGLPSVYRVRAQSPRALRGRIGRSLARKLRRARPEVVLADDHAVTLFFLGFETGPDRIRTGVEIAAELGVEAISMPSCGPYR